MNMKISQIALLIKEKFGSLCKVHLSDSEILIRDLLTDSRNHFSPETTLFFAINTSGGNDGHLYMADLYSKGVRNFVAEYLPDDLKDKGDINLFLVPDTISALTLIGSRHRERAKEMVAIIGSRGKTTLKEMIFQLSEPYFNISRSPRSYNSKIGVPLSLWSIPYETDIALIEAGISQKGEMKRLADTISPDTVIFTNIGDAHSQGFSSKREKAEEKSLMAFDPNVKTVIYPEDDSLVSETLKDLPSNVSKISWSLTNPEASLYIKVLPEKSNGRKLIEYSWKEGEKKRLRGVVEVAINKSYDIENISATLSFLLKESLTPEEIETRFKYFQRINTRLNVSEGINGCTVILDSYTSDLSSLLPAIDFMKRRKTLEQSLTLIISDLQHEGKEVDKTYCEIAKLVKEVGVSRFIGIGTSIKTHSDLFPKEALFFNTTEDVLKKISASDFNDEIILLKGGPEFHFEKIYEQLEAKKHETVLEVNIDAILRNYNYFRSYLPGGTGIIAMVKAFGYGAGSYEIAKTLQDAGAAYLAVAAIDEGIALRQKGISMPIIVMNPRSVNYKSLFNNKLEPVVYSFSILEELIKATEKYEYENYPIHLKLDTGMHRMGFEAYDLPGLLKILKGAVHIRVSSIFSHLATADCIDMDRFTIKQLELFESMSGEIIKELGYNVKRHILNSAGIIRFPKYHFDYVRLGIGLYGANTLPYDIEKPLSVVSTLRTVIINIREIGPEESVGYGRKGTVKSKSRIATLPIGYADGMNRKFGNGAIKVSVNGQLAPTIGNICMDATMIDVTGIDCKEGDPVEIFGENISVQTLADTLDTIPYEIFTSVSPRVKRIYFRE